MRWYGLKEVKEQTDHKSIYPLNWKILTSTGHLPSYFFINFTNLTPNQITLVWGFLGLIGTFLIALGGYTNMFIGILIYQLALWTDTVDGAVARLKNHKRVGGIYMDYFFHHVHRTLLLFTLGVGIFNTTGDIIYLYLGIWTGFFLVFDNLNKIKVYETFVIIGKYKELKKIKEFYGGGEDGYYKERGGWIKNINFYFREMVRPNNPFTFLFLSILFNVPQYYLVLMTVLAPLFFVRNFVRVYKRIANLPNN